MADTAAASTDQEWVGLGRRVGLVPGDSMKESLWCHVVRDGFDLGCCVVISINVSENMAEPWLQTVLMSISGTTAKCVVTLGGRGS